RQVGRRTVSAHAQGRAYRRPHTPAGAGPAVPGRQDRGAEGHRGLTRVEGLCGGPANSATTPFWASPSPCTRPTSTTTASCTRCWSRSWPAPSSGPSPTPDIQDIRDITSIRGMGVTRVVRGTTAVPTVRNTEEAPTAEVLTTVARTVTATTT